MTLHVTLSWIMFTPTTGVTMRNGKTRDLGYKRPLGHQVCVQDLGLCSGLIKFYSYNIQCFEQRKRGSQDVNARSLIQGFKMRVVLWFSSFFFFLSLATHIQRLRERLIESCVAYLPSKSQNSQENNTFKIHKE